MKKTTEILDEIIDDYRRQLIMNEMGEEYLEDKAAEFNGKGSFEHQKALSDLLNTRDSISKMLNIAVVKRAKHNESKVA